MSLPKEVKWVWDARWTSYWFGDKELFEFTENDFDQKAEELKSAGINAVIIFGGFHFRWCFVDEWPQLLECIKKICDSCHAHGIRVVDHHSANLVSAPLGTTQWNDIEPVKRGINIKSHPDYIQLLQNGDAIYKGIALSSMYQIDPRSGVYSRSTYKGWVMCHNNPDYQRLYFDHLAEIYDCGVDGIMTDDIAFFPANYGCGCIHCRRKFTKDTGYSMPPNGLDDTKFYNNTENKVYREWVLWRLQCNQEHQERVFLHFRSLGKELARPLYCSSSTNSHAPRGLAFTLNGLDGFYSTIFTEVNVTESQPHSFLRIGAESSERNALARRNRLPAMCLFYPHNKKENLFCWAITKTWGQSYWGTNNKIGFLKEMEMVNVGFNFEKKYPELYKQPESIAEVGVLFSAHTVWLHDDNDGQADHIRMSDPASTDCWAGWCETLALANIPFDTIQEEDLKEKRYFDRLRLIIVPNSVCLSDKMAKSLKSFVKKGGQLIITHQAGMKNENGAPRKDNPLAELMGADYKTTKSVAGNLRAVNNSEFKFARCKFGKTPTVHFKLRKNTKTIMESPDGNAGMFINKHGKGSVITFGFKPGRIVCINRHKRIGSLSKNLKKGEKNLIEIDFSINKSLTKLMTNSVRHLFGYNLQLDTKHVPYGFVMGIFSHGDHKVIHITNAAGVLADSGKTISVPSKIDFPKAKDLTGGNDIMHIKLRGIASKAILCSPEFAKEKELIVSQDGDYTVIEIPSTLIKCYSVIKVIQ